MLVKSPVLASRRPYIHRNEKNSEGEEWGLEGVYTKSLTNLVSLKLLKMHRNT